MNVMGSEVWAATLLFQVNQEYFLIQNGLNVVLHFTNMVGHVVPFACRLPSHKIHVVFLFPVSTLHLATAQNALLCIIRSVRDSASNRWLCFDLCALTYLEGFEVY